MEIESFSHAYGQSAYHFVFVPKYRYNVFRYEFVRKKCKEFFREIAENHGFKIHALEMEDDHLRLFVGMKPGVSVSQVIQLFKGASAYKLFRQFPYLRRYYRRGHFWSAGKFFRSVGNVTSDVIAHYIETSQGTYRPTFHMPKSEHVKVQKSLADFCT